MCVWVSLCICLSLPPFLPLPTPCLPLSISVSFSPSLCLLPLFLLPSSLLLSLSPTLSHGIMGHVFLDPFSIYSIARCLETLKCYAHFLCCVATFLIKLNSHYTPSHSYMTEQCDNLKGFFVFTQRSYEKRKRTHFFLIMVLQNHRV